MESQQQGRKVYVPIDGVTVVEEFTPFAEQVRASAFDAGFGTWRPNKGEVGSSVYDGMGFWGEHHFMLLALTKIFRAPIIPNSMFFRVTHEDTEPSYIHSDREMGDFTCIVYLSQHEEQYGTAFYRNRHTGADRMRSFAEMRTEPEKFEKLKHEMVSGLDKDWERTAFVPGEFNKAVIFEAPLYHSRFPRTGFGKSPEHGRLVWACHFRVFAGDLHG